MIPGTELAVQTAVNHIYYATPHNESAPVLREVWSVGSTARNRSTLS